VHAGLVATNAQGHLTLVNRNARQLHGFGDDDEVPDFTRLVSMLRSILLIISRLINIKFYYFENFYNLFSHSSFSFFFSS
jgi:sensor histidine kinase regulating citrate/malate metabolism